MHAVCQNQFEVVKLLLTYKDTLLKSSYYSAIFVAIEYSNLDMLKLVAAETNTHQKSTLSDAKPFMKAINSNKGDIANYLIEQGADVNSQNSDGETALIIAARYGSLEMVKLLIRNNADPLIKNLKGQTALIRVQNRLDKPKHYVC